MCYTFQLEKSSLSELIVTGEGLADDEIIRGFAQVICFNVFISWVSVAVPY